MRSVHNYPSGLTDAFTAHPTGPTPAMLRGSTLDCPRPMSLSRKSSTVGWAEWMAHEFSGMTARPICWLQVAEAP